MSLKAHRRHAKVARARRRVWYDAVDAAKLELSLQLLEQGRRITAAHSRQLPLAHTMDDRLRMGGAVEMTEATWTCAQLIGPGGMSDQEVAIEAAHALAKHIMEQGLMQHVCQPLPNKRVHQHVYRIYLGRPL